MHPNLTFRKPSKAQNVEFARQRSFGTLVVHSEKLPLISHIPFQLSADGLRLEGHFVRSNPIVRALDAPLEAIMVVSGGDAYISPDWYGVDNQVPTWNYVAVHIHGTLRLLDAADLRGILERISANMEQRLLPKPPWKLDKLDASTFAKLSRQIVPVAMDVHDIEGTWKLSQNKSEDARTGAIAGAQEAAIGNEVQAIAQLMQQTMDK